MQANNGMRQKSLGPGFRRAEREDGIMA
jgi:hypothetical protein